MGIAMAVPSLNLSAVLVDQNSPVDVSISFFGFSAGGLLLQGVDPSLDRQVRTYNLVEGRFLENPGADEVVLVREFAVENELTVGKSFDIILPNGVASLRLVGLIAKEGPGQQNNGSFGVLPLRAAQKLTERVGSLDQVDLVVADEFAGQETLERLRANLQSRLGEDFTVTYPAAQGQRVTQMLSNYQIGLNFLSGMALFVGAFLIFNAFTMTIVERTREFGMLRTVGMNRRQVLLLVLGEAFLLGMIGSTLGLVLGVLMAGSLGSLMGVLLSLDIQTIANTPLDTAFTGFAMGVIASLMAAGLPALQASRISPLEALRARSLAREGWLLSKGWIPGGLILILSAVILIANPFPYDVQFRLGSLVVFALFLGTTLMIPASLGIWQRVLEPLIRVVYGRSAQLGSANLQRARLRTTLTVTALLAGVAMMVIVWSITDSFKGDLDEWLKGFVGGDLYITSSLPLRQDALYRVENVPGVAAVTPVRYFEVKWDTPAGARENVLFMGFEPGSYARVSSFIFTGKDVNGPDALARVAAGDTVFVSSVISERYGIQSGDAITLVTRSGPRRFLVAAVVVDYYNQGLVIKGSWFDMKRYFGQSDANTFLVKVQPGADPSGVASRIDDLYGKRDRLIITTNRALMQRISGLEQQAFGLFDVLALITMIVGFFGITNTLMMNVLERTRELGMLRAVGMARRQIWTMILSEAALMGLIGGIMGLILGVILARMFMLAMMSMSGYRLEFVFPIEKAILALVIGLLTSQLGALFPALRATRIRILEAIRYE
jgi:putative ABC transport system permease protein